MITPTLTAEPPLELVELDDVDEVLELAELEELEELDELLELAALEELDELLELVELDELLELEGRGLDGRLEPPLSQPLASANRAMHAVPNFKSTINKLSDFRGEYHRLPATAKRPPGTHFACEAHQV